MLGTTSKSVLKYFVLFLLAAACCLAADSAPAALARAASKAQNSGQVVRAYLLYAEAAARDPHNESYRNNRNALKPLADLLSKAGIQSEPNRAELLASVTPEEQQRPLDRLTAEERQKQRELQPPVKLDATDARHDFHLRGGEKSVFDTVARAYGVNLVFDPQFQPQPHVQFDVDDVNFKMAMTALTRALKLQTKAGNVGFDWNDPLAVLAKIREECDEIEAEIVAGDQIKATAEVGDLLFAVVNLARHLHADPETALRACNRKFMRRFASIEKALAAQGKRPQDSTLAEMDALWNEAKAHERANEKTQDED